MNIEIGLLTLGPNLTDCGKPDFPKKINKKKMDGCCQSKIQASFCIIFRVIVNSVSFADRKFEIPNKRLAGDLNQAHFSINIFHAIDGIEQMYIKTVTKQFSCIVFCFVLFFLFTF